jgi:hypothetical protein
VAAVGVRVDGDDILTEHGDVDRLGASYEI